MTPSIPKMSEVLLPTLKAVSSLGGSGSIPEIVSTVITTERFTEQQQQVLHKGGPQTKIGYRIAWARTYLKYFGLLTNSARGVWAITEAGDQFLNDPADDDASRVESLQRMKADKIREATLERASRDAPPLPPHDGVQPTNSAREDDPDEDDDESLDDAASPDWKERLLHTLTSGSFTPAQFERLTQRLLREADFESVTVTGRPGDQGIDGTGTYRLGLLTFPVFFQCKRYSGSVSPAQVRDFRGAMQGRGEKGLLITTGAFTAAARAEASRDGATPIDLIDGERLCDLLREHELGVTTQTVQQVAIDPAFFAEI